MKVQYVKISDWRHFDNVELILPNDAPIVCLVGGNGTGKSHILELLADAAGRIGLSHGYSSQRGQAFSDTANIEVKFTISVGSIPGLDTLAEHYPETSSWDRTLTVIRTISSGPKVVAGGVPEADATAVASRIIGLIRESVAVHYLMLDADRAYPHINMDRSQLASALDTDWESNKKNQSYQQTRTLYEEWFRYLLGTENQENSKHIAAIRRARDARGPVPTFVDKMESYKLAIRKVLPHLLFTGINQQRRIEFDSTGVPLLFDQLSSGEREIAFLVGQIERFGLRRGLLLVDEPELHLNYDLLRNWIGFLKDTVEEGQIWLATHSLEVVEVTGPESTFLLERNDASRKVASASSLINKPVVATLSRAIGSPAFSISNLAFIFIEGREELGERERFRLLCGQPANVRFLEGGSCREIEKRLLGLKDIAVASGEPLRIGGIVDQDWRPTKERERLKATGLFMLGVHEVENFLLHPATVEYVMTAIGQDPKGFSGMLEAACDYRAGVWIFNGARSQDAFKDFPPPIEATRELAQRLRWNDFKDIEDVAGELARLDRALDDDQSARLSKWIQSYASIYARHRKEGTLWRACEGKEVFRALVSQIGFADAQTAERAILKAWTDKPELVPAELGDLRAYIRRIT